MAARSISAQYEREFRSPSEKKCIHDEPSRASGHAIARLSGAEGLNVGRHFIEQPLAPDDWDGMRRVMRESVLPIIADESCRLESDVDRCPGCFHGINVKLTKCGGLTPAREARDLAAALGLAMTIEDSWGGDIITAAIAHLAHSTPEELRFTATDFNSYVTVSTAAGAPQRVQGRMAAADEPGLGVTPRMEVLDEPVAIFGI